MWTTARDTGVSMGAPAWTASTPTIASVRLSGQVGGVCPAWAGAGWGREGDLEPDARTPGCVACVPAGQFCTEDVDECQLQPNACHNGGTCFNTLGGHSCVCVNGWTGESCSQNIDDCATAVCFHGATCHDRVASFYCACPMGKTGERGGCWPGRQHPGAVARCAEGRLARVREAEAGCVGGG